MRAKTGSCWLQHCGLFLVNKMDHSRFAEQAEAITVEIASYRYEIIFGALDRRIVTHNLTNYYHTIVTLKCWDGSFSCISSLHNSSTSGGPVAFCSSMIDGTCSCRCTQEKCKTNGATCRDISATKYTSAADVSLEQAVLFGGPLLKVF